MGAQVDIRDIAAHRDFQFQIINVQSYGSCIEIFLLILLVYELSSDYLVASKLSIVRAFSTLRFCKPSYPS